LRSYVDRQLLSPRLAASAWITAADLIYLFGDVVQPIVIVDYGMGNLRSVQKALEKVGYQGVVTSDPNRIAEADKVILPGVGAFRDAIGRLHDAGMVPPLVEHIRAGRPFLGICLGLQLLFTKSYEDGEHAGLDLFPGDIVRFPDVPGLKVPHMGWNQVGIRQPAPIFSGLPDESAFYFVHSYYAVCRDPTLVAGETDYPTPFTSVIWQGNLFATQFHPEKSQRAGLSLLHKFATLR
jgi:glutamine amidotransferase